MRQIVWRIKNNVVWYDFDNRMSAENGMNHMIQNVGFNKIEEIRQIEENLPVKI